MLKSRQTIAVLVLMLIFSTVFIRNTRQDLPLIFQKDLHAHDESSNSVVAANITRKFFPPMVRVNPLNEQQGNWMEGPYWQHIPPLFAYVPYIFFTLDGEVTIEMKRLAFAFVTLLTGLMFIFGVYRYRKSLWAAGAATLAAIFWVNTPFTHELITGFAFGVSDIVLAFTVVASFCAILWYINGSKGDNGRNRLWKLFLIGAIVALPIMAKNLLGAIPAATFFILLLRDHRAYNKKLLASFGGFLGMLLIYYLPLYFASPETFKNEIIVSFLHFKQLEGWARPWHWYLSDYLPNRYLFDWTWAYFGGLILGAGIGYRVWGKVDRKDKILLAISGGWFVWNLVAITLVTSKVPNFIYQSFLLSIFFIVYVLIIPISDLIGDLRKVLARFPLSREWVTTGVLLIAILVTGFESVRFVRAFDHYRSSTYNYQTEHEKFYQAGEQFQQMGVDENDLVIIRVSDNDCWFRYYILYLTGTESKTLLEIHFNTVPYVSIKEKYKRMFIVINKQEALPQVGEYSYIEFDLTKMDVTQIESVLQAYLKIHEEDIQNDILRIKKDKTSCQWLVPDPILNAP